MRILIITTSYPTRGDGSEAAGGFVQDFVKTLGDNVDVGVVFPVEEKLEKHQYSDISLYPFMVSKLPLSLLSPSNPGNWLPIISTLRTGQKAVNGAVQDFRPDHILALWALPSGYWAKRVCRSQGIPYSIWALGSDIWSLGKVPVIKSFLKNVLQNAQLCLADGYQLRDDVAEISRREAHFMPSTRILPLSKTKELKKSGPYNLAFLGRWHPNKGIDILLDALELLDDSDWLLIKSFQISGGGPLESLVKDRVEVLQDMGRPIKLSGYLDTNAASDLLLSTDYLVIPSRIESIPVVFSDALQASTPMVVTPVGDFSVLFKDSPPGVIASNLSAESIARSIKELLATAPADYSKNMKASLQQFSIKKSVETFLKKISDKS